MVDLGKERIEITLGMLLMITGFLLAFFMVIKILASSFALNFLSYSLSLLGLFLGLHGLYGLIALHQTERARDEDS